MDLAASDSPSITVNAVDRAAGSARARPRLTVRAYEVNRLVAARGRPADGTAPGSGCPGQNAIMTLKASVSMAW
jgi:hypothetical protein